MAQAYSEKRNSDWPSCHESPIRSTNRKAIGSTPVGSTRNFPKMPVSLAKKLHLSLLFSLFSKTLTSAEKIPRGVVLGFVITEEVTITVVVQRDIEIDTAETDKHVKVRNTIP